MTTILAILAAGALAAAPAASPVRDRSIDYIRSIDSVHEYVKPKSFFGKLFNLVVGPPDNIPSLVRPYGVTQDSLGRLLVADPGQRTVHMFDFERRRYKNLKAPRREPFLSPVGIAVDGGDNVYITDSARACIYVFNKKGKFKRRLGDPGGGVTLKRPTGLTIDAKRGWIYLTDTLRHQVLILTLDGSLVRAVGRRGAGPAEFNYPTAVTLSKDALYVVDAMNFRIQVLTSEGDYVISFGRLGNQTGTLNRPKGIAADSEGNLYVVDALFETVQVFSPAGRLLYYFGSTGAGPGQFELPAGIYIDPRDCIFVADSFNRRVQEFRPRREGF